jgi:hypothetical protein
LPLKLHFFYRKKSLKRNTHCQCARERRRRRKEKREKKKSQDPKPVGNLAEERRREKITLGMMKYSGDKAVSNKSVRE